MSESFSTDSLFEHYRIGAGAGGSVRGGGEAGGEAHVRVNFVSSVDGAVTFAGRSGGLGGANDRRLMRVLRAMSDAVLVGAGTVRSEGYGGLTLTDDVLAWRRDNVGSVPPRIVIASNSLGLTPDISVFHKSEVRPLVAAPAKAWATPEGQALLEVADALSCGETALDLAQLVSQLAALGLSRVLCEGGPHLFGALLEADLVDEVCLTVAPVLTAGRAGRITASPDEVLRSFQPTSPLVDDEGFVFLRYLRAAGAQ